ncbi:hypothetical protein D3C73_1180140 [compost metagenome]
MQLDPVGGGVARLIDVDLDRHGYAGQDAGIFPARKLRIHVGCPRHDLVRTMIHDCAQRRIHGVEPFQGALRGVDGGHFTFTDTGGKLNCGQTPKIRHASLLRSWFFRAKQTLAPVAPAHKPRLTAGVRYLSASNTSTIASATARTRAVRFRSPCMTSHKS